MPACVQRITCVKSIQVKVKPNARVSALEPADDGSWVAWLKSPPVDGKANDELIGLIARRFGCRRADVSIRSGAGARIKLIRLDVQDSSPTLAMTNPKEKR